MPIVASVLQLVGLAAFTAGAVLEYGIAGALASAGLAAVYVGLAMERDT